MKNIMLWKAILDNDEVLIEKKNSFDDIDRNKLKYFILEGFNTTFIHTIETGQTTINNNRILFLLNDKLLGKSNDIINYKEKIKIANIKNSDNKVTGYYTGWKEKNEDFNNIELLYWVDMVKQQVKVRLTLTPKNESVLNSVFSIIINGVIINKNIELVEINKKKRFVFEIFINNK